MKIIHTYPVTLKGLNLQPVAQVHVAHKDEIITVEIPGAKASRDAFQWLSDNDMLVHLLTLKPRIDPIWDSTGANYSGMDATWTFTNRDSALQFKLAHGGV